MGASLFVGRVGGLAVALGVGAAMFSGSGLASADTGSRGADSTGASNATDTTSSQSSAPSRRAGVRADKGAAAKTNNRQRATTEATSAAIAPAAAVARRSAALTIAAPASAVLDSAATDSIPGDAPSPAVDDSSPSVDPAVFVATGPDPTSDPETAPEPGPVMYFMTQRDGAVVDGANTDPQAPADSAASWALVAVARRHPLALANSNAVAPQVTSSATVTSGSLSVNPVVESSLADGIVQGNLNAVSTRSGVTLAYSFIGGSCGSNCGLGDINGKISLGTVPNSPTTTDPQSFTILPYANWLDGGTKGTQTFGVRVTEVTGFDTFVTGIPLVGSFASPVIALLQKLPLISDLLAPIIGTSVVATVSVNVADLAPAANTPIAFTYTVTSFDGVGISTNFFPASGLVAGDTAATVINMPGLGSAGQSDPYAKYGVNGETLGVGPLRDAQYNVVTVTPRGEFNSGGILQLDNPFFEGRDVSAVITWLADPANTPAELDGAGDPLLGMVGGSYGGGIQLTAASNDSRIDAIVPDIAWNSLNSSLYPDNTFKTAYASLLYLSLLTTGARVNSLIPRAILTGDLLGWISQSAQATLASSGPTALLANLTAPTLLTQGIVDVLFPLQESIANAQAILANGLSPSTKMTWFCGGHGVCLDPISPIQASTLRDNALAWLDDWVRGGAPNGIPNFQWFDQFGDYYSSDLLPFETDFNDGVITGSNPAGGLLPVVPLLGGSNGTGGLYGLGGGALAKNAINVAVDVPENAQVVGAPTVTLTYQGLGTTRAVFAQIVNDATGQVLGNIVTPVPVTLDGKEHTLTMNLSDIVYTYDPESTGGLTVQITSSATAFENLTSFGLVNISDITVTLPNRKIT
jgi:ABC-2 type transport system ATP-binding protein